MPANTTTTTDASAARRAMAASFRSLGGIRRQLSVELLEFGANACVVAIRAITVAKTDVNVFCEIGFDAFPAGVGGPNLFAVGANGKDFFEFGDTGKGALEVANSVGKLRLQVEDALACPHAVTKLVVVERLADIIVGPGCEAGHDVLLCVAGS